MKMSARVSGTTCANVSAVDAPKAANAVTDPKAVDAPKVAANAVTGLKAVDAPKVAATVVEGLKVVDAPKAAANVVAGEARASTVRRS